MRDAKKLLTAALCGLALVGAGCGPAISDVATNFNASGLNVNRPPAPPVNADRDDEDDEKDDLRQLEVALAAQNASGISGKAALLEMKDGKTKVLVSVTGGTAQTVRPAHIHVGACPTPGVIKWNLKNVEEGKSVTVLDADFDDVIGALPLAINLHESAQNLPKYIACGDLLSSRVTARLKNVASTMGFQDEDEDEDDEDEDEKNWRQMEVTLAAQNNSGFSGKAVLLEHEDGKTKVMIDVKGEATTGKRPAHIHLGACPTPGAVKWNLADVVQGKSVTTINAKFDDVLKALPLAINLHESSAAMSKYIACGDLLSAKVMLKQAGIEAMMGFPNDADDDEDEDEDDDKDEDEDDEDEDEDDDRKEGSGNGGNGY